MFVVFDISMGPQNGAQIESKYLLSTKTLFGSIFQVVIHFSPRNGTQTQKDSAVLLNKTEPLFLGFL